MRFLSKIVNAAWLADSGFLQAVGGQTVGDVMARKTTGGSLPSFVHTHPTETVREAIDILSVYGVSQMPVVRAEPPVMTAEIVGAVHDRDLLDALFNGRAALADPLSQHMGAPLPMVGAGEPVQAAMVALEKADAAVVVADGRPTGVVTRQDVLAFLSHS
jgi:cystathionine beta-synthase